MEKWLDCKGRDVNVRCVEGTESRKSELCYLQMKHSKLFAHANKLLATAGSNN